MQWADDAFVEGLDAVLLLLADLRLGLHDVPKFEDIVLNLPGTLSRGGRDRGARFEHLHPCRV